MTTASTLQVCQNYHQDLEATINCQINLKLCFLHLPVHVDDVALKNFAIYFLHQSQEEREHAEKLMKEASEPTRWMNIFSGYQKLRLDENGLENRQNAMECILYLEKSVNQSLLDFNKLSTDKNNPHLCDFIEIHYLNEQVKATKELGDHIFNLCRLGAPEIGIAEYLFNKHTLKTMKRAKPWVDFP